MTGCAGNFIMNNIILAGYMGSGKTTVGIKLSYHFRIPFEDTDRLIEKRQEMTVSAIFEKYGEAAFRDMETELLQELVHSREQSVIALGGGTPMRPGNRELIKALGTVVYLRIRPETIVKRLCGDTTRPLLQGTDAASKVRAMLSERAPVYEAVSDIVIDVDNMEPQEIIDRIEEELNEITGDQRTQS